MSALALVWLVGALAGAALFASGWLFGRAAGRRAVAVGPQDALAEAPVPGPGLAEAAQRQVTQISPAVGGSVASEGLGAASSAPAPGAPAPPVAPEPAPEPAPELAVNPLGTIDLDVSDLEDVGVAEDFAASTVDAAPDAMSQDGADAVTRAIEAFAEPSRPALAPLAAPTVPPAPRPRRSATTRRPTMPVNLSAADTREGELARLLGELEADGVKRQLVLADEVGLPVAAWRAEGTADVMAAMAAYTSEVGERFESLLTVGRARAVTIVCDDCFLEVRPFAAGEGLYHVAALGPALPSPDLFLGIQARIVQALAQHTGAGPSHR